jgi:cob(I)alamin adenosyltransferase
MRVNRVYTRHGDSGKTHLVGTQEVSKSAQRVVAYGTVDELNAALGCAYALLDQEGKTEQAETNRTLSYELDYLQNLLFILGGDLATRVEDRWEGMPVITADHTLEIENLLNHFNMEIPPLEEFILPRGPAPSAFLHLARTICRRAEREVVRLSEVENIGDCVIPLINRLSDFLFVLARWYCLKSDAPESLWRR